MANRSARALVVEMVADVKDFVRGTQKADDTLSDFVRDAERDLDKLERANKDATDDMARHYDNLSREAKRSFDKIGREAKEETSNTFGEAGRESGSEFASNLSETLSSGDFTALGTDTAAGLVAGFANMPGLGAALAPLAAGAALIFGSIVKEAQKHAALVTAAFERAASDAVEALNATQRGASFNELLEQLGGMDKGWKKIVDWSKKAGTNAIDIKNAYVAGGTPLQNQLVKLKQIIDNGTTVVKRGKEYTTEVSAQARAAQHLYNELGGSNDALKEGIELAGMYASILGDAAIEAAILEGHVRDSAAYQKSMRDYMRDTASAAESLGGRLARQ